jgi:hypothetical protein
MSSFPVERSRPLPTGGELNGCGLGATWQEFVRAGDEEDKGQEGSSKHNFKEPS